MVSITDKPIDFNKVVKAVHRDAAGALCLFLGTIRDKTDAKEVIRLEYDSYDSMAVLEMEKLCDRAKEKWDNIAVEIVHRKGVMQTGEIAVAIAVSTPHRKESFDACRFIIDTLKETVPIWKKEVFEGGEEWVSAHP